MATNADQDQKQNKKIQLYSFATPNGQKIGIVLEELGLPYDAHTVDITKNQQFEESFLKVNPNNKIPAIVDPDGPDGKEITVFESGAILLYLAEKTGKLLPKDATQKWAVVQWLFWQMAGVGPMLGQYNHFAKYAPEKIPYAIERYAKEAKRLFGVLNKQLEGHDYVVGNEYTVADISLIGWVNYFYNNPNAKQDLQLDSYANVAKWLARCLERPAVKTGLTVCKS